MAKKTASAETRKYYLTYLLPVSFTDAELASFRDAIAGLVTKHKGKVVTTDDWGKKPMAYKIKHAGKWQTEAVYTHLTLELPADQVQPLEKDLYLQTQIIRHLLVRIEGDETKTAE